MSAGDIRYGRRGGRWASTGSHDQAAIDAWHRQRDALEAAAAAAGEQLTLEDALAPED